MQLDVGYAPAIKNKNSRSHMSCAYFQIPPLLGTFGQNWSHPLHKRRFKRHLADRAACSFQEFVEGFVPPVPEKLRVPLVRESFNGMAHHVPFWEKKVFDVVREIQEAAVYGKTTIDLIGRHPWAAERIGREAFHQIN